MDKEPTVYELGTRQIVTLFRACSDLDGEQDRGDIDEQRAIILSDWLSEPLRSRQPAADNPAQTSQNGTMTVWALSEQPVRELLEREGARLSLMGEIKEFARSMSVMAESEPERHAANAVYYLAIANAIVCCGQKITSFSYGDLEQSFELLRQETWIPAPLRELLGKAVEHCRVRSDSAT